MITKTKINFYITYLLFLAIWLGSAFHSKFSTNYTWYVDPITHINHTTEYITPGIINPWPFSTMLLLIFTIIALFMFKNYNGLGKKEVMISLIGTLVILAITFIYFVPTLGKIFGDNNQYNNQSLIKMSRMWVILSFVRFIIIVFLFLWGLRGLRKLNRLN